MKLISQEVTIIPMLLLFCFCSAAPGQLSFITNNDAITITGYTGASGDVAIPSMTNGYPVISIGDRAFGYCSNLTSITIPSSVTSIGIFGFWTCSNLVSISIPDSVTNIGDCAFAGCTSLTSLTLPNKMTTIGQDVFAGCISLTSVTIPPGVTTIGSEAFFFCIGLTNVTIPNSVTSIRDSFYQCTNLTSIIIPSSVTNIGSGAFFECTSLSAAYFEGDAPSIGLGVFDSDNNPTVFYLPGTSGWSPTFGGRPTTLWLPRIQTGDSAFGVRTNQFGFHVAWASGMAIVVEGCTDLSNPAWCPLSTNTLAGDTFYFSDPSWINYPSRTYRIRWH